MKRSLILFMVLGLIAGSMGTAEAEQRFERTERTVEVSYGPYSAPVSPCNGPAGSLACAVVETRATEDFFTAKVTDAHGQPVFVQVSGGYFGTFCGETTRPISFDPGSRLEFRIEPTPNFFSHWGTGWVGPLDCPYRLKTTGTISVTLWGWTISEDSAPSSSGPGGSPAPDPSPTAQPEIVERSVDLSLRRHLRSVGAVTSDDASCRSNVSVVIQRKRSSGWVEVGSTTTADNGAFSLRLTDRPGRYRAVATEIGTPETTCLMARSTTVKHHH